MASGGFFRKFRILILLFILFIVAGDQWLTKMRTTDWDRPLTIVVYPINGDSSDVAAKYIEELALEDLAPIETFFTEEAEHYELSLAKPVELRLAPRLDDMPPKVPRVKSPLKVMWWSLKMRLWTVTLESDYSGPPPDIKMFVMYFNPEARDSLDHSLGLEKGLVGIVNAFADKKFKGKNNVVITHEILHTVGATDKYDLATGRPIYPQGYAKPKQDPLYPQEYAEIMGGMIPTSRAEFEMPDSLGECLIGPTSALEIRWVEEI